MHRREDMYDIGADGQGTLAFSMALDDLLNGQSSAGLGSHLMLVDGGQAELFSLDLLHPYSFSFDPAVCQP